MNPWRRSSVPSSPSPPHPHPSRHRRLSEPFNTPSSPRLSRSLDPHISRAAHDIPSGATKFEDQTKPILFKTEMCRSWEEKGSCRYGYALSQGRRGVDGRNKCQFAHSQGELRPVPRHPKYKTQLCKTFLEVFSHLPSFCALVCL